MVKTLTQEEFQQQVCSNFPGWEWTFFSYISGFKAVGKSMGQQMEWEYYNHEGWRYIREGSAKVLVKGHGESMDEVLDSQSTVVCSFEAKLNDSD